MAISEAWWKTSQDVVASLRGELHNSEAEHRRLSEQYCIVACEKATLEDRLSTLENQMERLENQVSFLAREKGVLAGELDRCQYQLARARVNGSIAHGNLQ